MGPTAVILGVLLFLLAHVVRPGKSLGLRVTGTLFLLALVLGPPLLNALLPAARAWPGSRTAQLSFSLQKGLKKLIAQPPAAILLLEGGSHTEYGVDGAQLQTELQNRGISAGVLQLSFGGANAFSRIAVMEAFRSRLTKSEAAALQHTRLILLHEVHSSYDQYPLYGFALKGEQNIQDISTVSPHQAYRAWRAVQERKQDSGAVATRLVQNLNAHCFRAGALSQKEFWTKQRGYKAFSPRQGKPLHELQGDLAAAEAALRLPEKKITIPVWLDWRNQWMSEKALAGLVDDEWYQAPPTLQAEAWNYESSWARRTPDQFMIRGLSILPELLRPECWNDPGHLSGEGAKLYTSWLAGELATKLAPDVH